MTRKFAADGAGVRSGSSGLGFERFFTPPGGHAHELILWERRTARISNEKDEAIFEQHDVEVPCSWSQRATNVVAQKYFRRRAGGARESSVRGMIDRVVDTLAGWGRQDGYFAAEEDATSWTEDLRYLLAAQYAAFNSPVWFNLGVPGNPPQGSACFINSVQDTMESILELARTEGMLFKLGSGTGTNLSALRSSKEALSGGGTASGPVSFMRGYDSFAGAIKSGGTTRRAAKMVILNVDHPDILEFVRCKAAEERKAWALIDAGYDAAFDVPGGAYDSVRFQNANHSVRVTDEFMSAVEAGGEWSTHAVTDGQPLGSHPARQLWHEIAEAAWTCGDPGLQYDNVIQGWNCVPRTGRINATNPCAEHVFLDDTACNLASLNLRAFQDQQGGFDTGRFRRAVDILLTAQEIIVSHGAYPTETIARNTRALRPLGLGYANLGALLMSMGLPYDSDGGRAVAATITAIMTGEAYAQSARMAAVLGPFAEFAKNREPMLEVLRLHREAARALDSTGASARLVRTAQEVWDEAIALGERHGYRNAQVTVIPPTGTVSLMMDCDTTGIEPDLALVTYKTLVGGGMLKMLNGSVAQALRRLGYDQDQSDRIVNFIDEQDTIEGAPHLKPQDVDVFDCALRPLRGTRSIAPMGHVRMLAAVQPFVSGSISKTVNLPTEASVEDVEEVYLQGWKLGLKCLAIYRDGCKRSQPLSTSAGGAGGERPDDAAATARPVRRRLPDERRSLTHKFDIQGHEGYITVGMYPDGSPGEVFIAMAKEGSTISGMMDAFATQTSVALQYGVPLAVMVKKFSHMRFEPGGFTRNPQIPIASSVMDYVFRWLASRFLDRTQQEAVGVLMHAGQDASTATEALPGSGRGQGEQAFKIDTDAPSCADCGALMARAGSCYVCLRCGATSGCS